MTNEMKKFLDTCFDARLRELEALKTIADEKQQEKINAEIKLTKSMKQAQNDFQILHT